MDVSGNKLMEPGEAVDRFVEDGAHISIGGFTMNRNPMALVYEIIRKKKKGLHLYAHSNGQGVDELIGAGCVESVEIAYGGNGRFAPTCVRFRKAVEEGKIQVEDYTNYQMTLRFTAGAMGIPFLPTRSSLGTDIVEKWGFTEQQRKKAPRLPNKKLIVMENPFDDWGEVEKVVLVPAINPDVTIIHAQMADRQGTTRIEGLPFADVEQAKASSRVIVTCERLVETEEIRKNPDGNQLPFFSVDAVVPITRGAYPTACYRYYDYDPVYLNEYRNYARDEIKYEQYLQSHIYDVRNHGEFIDRFAGKRMESIKADPVTGYAVGLDRR